MNPVNVHCVSKNGHPYDFYHNNVKCKRQINTLSIATLIYKMRFIFFKYNNGILKHRYSTCFQSWLQLARKLIFKSCIILFA